MADTIPNGLRTLTGYIPLVLFTLTLAAAGGALYTSIGRIGVLEADLTSRNEALPAKVTAMTLNKLQESVIAAGRTAVVQDTEVKGVRRELDGLHDLASEGVHKYAETVAALARVETRMADIQERMRHLRDDLNAHDKADEELLRDRLRATMSGGRGQ